MEVKCSSETPVLSEPHEVTSQITTFFIGTARLCSGDVTFSVRYELGFYISEDSSLHSQRRENFKFYIALAGWAL
jgi:hypothetical protein